MELKKGWEVLIYTTTIHVIPKNDTLKHTEDPSCSCKPHIDNPKGTLTKDGYKMLWIHSSFDKREFLIEKDSPYFGLLKSVEAKA